MPKFLAGVDNTPIDTYDSVDLAKGACNKRHLYACRSAPTAPYLSWVRNGDEWTASSPAGRLWVKPDGLNA